ncbi:MAG TPA: hypothetical protein VD999_01840 [Vitreimonas sp.]|nr:hypothetical protein [Vitreimonas sp.]
MAQTNYHKPTSISEAWSNPRYQGKIVIESPEGLYSTSDESKAIQMYRKLQRKYPQSPPVSTVIPKGLLLPLPFQVA